MCTAHAARPTCAPSPCRHAVCSDLSNHLTALCAGQARSTGNYAVVREQLKKLVSALRLHPCIPLCEPRGTTPGSRATSAVLC